jgi:hypothetical protein
MIYRICIIKIRVMQKNKAWILKTVCQSGQKYYTTRIKVGVHEIHQHDDEDEIRVKLRES